MQLILLTVPLGNLGDLTARVSQALTDGKCFIVEDTRKFFQLLDALKISRDGKRVVAFHDQSPKSSIEFIFNQLLPEYQTLYVLSEAGSPIISDPGLPLIREAYTREVSVDTYPGASAPVTALELSGLDPIPFSFHGFFPRKENDIKEKLNQINSFVGTHIFFESPHRILATMDYISKEFPDLEVAIARELTKMYQTLYRFIAKEWNAIKTDFRAQGEMTVLISTRAENSSFSQGPQMELANELIDQGLNPKKLSKLLSMLTKRSNKEIYNKLFQDQ